MSIVFLCLDFGTESVRGELIDLKGKTHASKTSKYQTYFGSKGIVEQNPNELFSSMMFVCQYLVQEANFNFLDIEAVCVDTTACSLVFLNKSLEPIGNLMLWMDIRAEKLSNKYDMLDKTLLNYHPGGKIQATWMPLRMRWIKEFKPELYNDIYYVCELLNWIEYKLTDRLVVSKNIATLKWYYNSSGKKGWPTSLFSSLDLDDLIDKIAPDVVATGELVSEMSSNMVNKLGLHQKPKVIEGGADAFIGMIGLNAVKDGDVALIGGSSHVMLCQTTKTIHIKGLYGSFPNGLITGLNILEGSQTASGASLKWFVENFIDKKDRDYKILDKKALKIPLGSEGLLVLDHWQGNRSPFMDSNCKGVIRGLSLSHTPYHIYRAIIEGVSLGTAVIFDLLTKSGYKINNFTIGGGVAKSELWVRIHADSLGIPVRQASIENAPLLGCGMIAAYGCGYYSSIEEASNAMCPEFNTILPEKKNRVLYEKMKEEYINTYYALAKESRN